MELPYELINKLEDWTMNFENENPSPTYRELAIIECVRLLSSLTHDEHYSKGEHGFNDYYRHIADACAEFVNGEA